MVRLTDPTVALEARAAGDAPALLPDCGPTVTQVRMRRSGGRVVGLDAVDSTGYRWRVADRRTSRVVAPGWTFDRLGGPYGAGLLRPGAP